YPMAPVEIGLVIDGQTVYRMRNDSFSYTQSGEIVLEYDLRGRGPASRYTLLFRKQGNTRSDRSGAGMVHSVEGLDKGLFLEKGYHRAEIAATDASGNISRAHFVFSTGLQPVISEARRLDAVSELIVGSADPDGGNVRGEVFGSLDGGKSWESIPLKPFGSLSTAVVADTAAGLYRYRATDDEGAWAESWIGTGPVSNEPAMAFFALDLRESDGGLVLDAASDAGIAGLPVLRSLDPVRPDTLKIYRTGVSTFSARIEGKPPGSGVSVFHLSGRDFRGYRAEGVLAARVMTLGSGSRAAVTVGDSVDAVLESPSVRGTLTCATLDCAWPGPPTEGLTAKSSPFRVLFPAWKLERGLRLKTDTDRRTGLFVWDEDKGWQCVGVPAMEDGSAGVEEPGIYCLFSDGIPPVIAHAALEEGHGNSSFFRKTYCILPVTEEGSGIDPFSARATINGTGVVVEWDAPRDRLVIPLPRSIPTGMVRLEVEVSDRSGNRTVGEYGFMLQ
ncbi:MAG TPA: hypothetical protein VLA34_13950, partial [Candidatus Krumholzibacterium sp.]|nr:hypothetical protein [Candidatus Krumholzibacterium sp.]